MWPFSPKKDNTRKAEKAERRSRLAARTHLFASAAASAALVCFVVFGAVKICRVSDSFGLTKFILINPSEKVTTADIKRFLDLYPGQNIFSVNLEDVRRVLLDHHWIKDVRVTRVPPETIELFVIERQPVAILSAGDERGKTVHYLVDETAMPYAPAAGDDLPDLPKITGFKMEWFRDESEESKIVADELVHAIRLMETAFKENAVAPGKVRRIHFDAEKGYSIFMDSDQKEVVMGWPPYGDNFGRLKQTLAGLADRKDQIEAIDLREADFVVVRGLQEKGQT